MLCIAVPKQACDAQYCHVRQDLGFIHRNRVGKNDLFNRRISQSFDGRSAQNSMSCAGENPLGFLFLESHDCIYQRSGSIDHVIADDDVSSAHMADDMQEFRLHSAPCDVYQ